MTLAVIAPTFTVLIQITTFPNCIQQFIMWIDVTIFTTKEGYVNILSNILFIEA